MPVWRSTSTAAQAQNACSSSRVRSRGLPVAGSCAQVLLRGQRRAGGQQLLPGESEGLPGAAAAAAPSRAAAVLRARSTAAARTGRTGIRSRVRASMRDLRRERLFLRDDLLGPYRAGDGPRAPAGGVAHRPFGDVQVEGPHRGQVADRVVARQPGAGVLAPSAAGACLVMIRCFHAAATAGSRRRELMPGWCSSRSRQNSLPSCRARLRMVEWSMAAWRSRR